VQEGKKKGYKEKKIEKKKLLAQKGKGCWGGMDERGTRLWSQTIA